MRQVTAQLAAKLEAMRRAGVKPREIWASPAAHDCLLAEARATSGMAVLPSATMTRFRGVPLRRKPAAVMGDYDCYVVTMTLSRLPHPYCLEYVAGLLALNGGYTRYAKDTKP